MDAGCDIETFVKAGTPTPLFSPNQPHFSSKASDTASTVKKYSNSTKHSLYQTPSSISSSQSTEGYFLSPQYPEPVQPPLWDLASIVGLVSTE